MERFAPLVKRIEAELASATFQADNYRAQAMAIKEVVRQATAAGDRTGIRAAAGMHGGLVKRWRGWLITHLTECALAGADTSREDIRRWQRRVFGRSVNSCALRQYAKPERSGGGRANRQAIDPAIERKAAEIYAAHKDAITALPSSD